MRKTSRPYNTALKSGIDYELRNTLSETEYYESDRGVVFHHDITNPYDAFKSSLISERAECIYCEIPWRHGYESFYKRNGLVPPMTFKHYLSAVAYLIMYYNKPTYIVCGVYEAERISPYVPTVPITLNSAKCRLLAIKSPFDLIYDTVMTDELLEILAKRFKSVYDFGCGYGNSLKYFEYFVGSDIDKKCLNYIERNLLHGNS